MTAHVSSAEQRWRGLTLMHLHGSGALWLVAQDTRVHGNGNIHRVNRRKWKRSGESVRRGIKALSNVCIGWVG